MSNSDRPGTLRVTAAGADIQVLDAYLRPVPDAAGVGTVTATLPPGAYTIVCGLEGASVSRELLVRPGSANDVPLAVPLAPAAPVSSSPTANETHGELAHDLSRARVDEGASALVIVLRGLRGHDMAPLEQSPEISGRDGAPVALPAPTFDPHVQPPRAVGWRVDLAPGAYRVRWARSRAQPAEHTVWAAADRKTVLFVPQTGGGPDVAGMSMNLLSRTRAYDAFDPHAETVERALSHLRRRVRRRALEELTDLLGARTPLTAQLFAAAALATHADATSDARIARRLAATVRRLHDELGDMPDVFALGRAVPASGVTGWVDVPPMLSACMDVLLAADREDPDVIPAGSVVEAVSGERYTSRPWLLWRPLERQAFVETGAGDAADGGAVGGGAGSFEGDFAELPMTPTAPPVESATRVEPVSPTVLRRVEELVTEAAPRLELPAHETAEALGADEIAHRLDVPTALVERSLTDLYG